MSMDINSKDTAFLEITVHKWHNLSTNFVRVTCNMSAEIRKSAFHRQVLQDTRGSIIMVKKVLYRTLVRYDKALRCIGIW